MVAQSQRKRKAAMTVAKVPKVAIMKAIKKRRKRKAAAKAKAKRAAQNQKVTKLTATATAQLA